MPFRSAQSARVLIGLLHASAYTRSLGGNATTEMLDVTCLTDASKVFIPGQDTSTFNIGGPLDVDPAANAQFDALMDQHTALVNVPITFGMDGIAQGSTVWLINALQTQLAFSAPVAGTQDWSSTSQTDGMTDFNGVVIDTLQAITIDTNGASVNNGAATTGGAVAHLHVTAFSGLTSNSVILEHSTNNSVWSTLDTFTLVSGVTSERRVIAGTINQYLRIRDDVTGTGSCTRLVAVARR